MSVIDKITSLHNTVVKTTDATTTGVAQKLSAQAHQLNVVAQSIHKEATNAIIIALSAKWISVGMRPKNLPRLASTFAYDKRKFMPSWDVDRFDYHQLFSVQLGEYFLPTSQTYTLRAKKRINVSSLVDGPDIIQQTRKEAKTLDCTMRLTLRPRPDGKPYQDDLRIVDADNEVRSITEFLQDLYESDKIFEIQNDDINNTFGITHGFISEYRFIPRTGMGTYNIEFSITEADFDENVLTFSLNELTSDAPVPKWRGVKTELPESARIVKPRWVRLTRYTQKIVTVGELLIDPTRPEGSRYGDWWDSNYSNGTKPGFNH